MFEVSTAALKNSTVQCAHCGNMFTRFVEVKRITGAGVELLFKCESGHAGFTDLVVRCHEGESILFQRKTEDDLP